MKLITLVLTLLLPAGFLLAQQSKPQPNPNAAKEAAKAKDPFVPGGAGVNKAAPAKPTADPFADNQTPKADESEEFPKANILIHTEYFDVPTEALTKWLMDPATRAASDAKLREAVLGLVSAGQAKLIDSSMVATVSGKKAVVESNREMLYAAEFDPGQHPTPTATIGQEGHVIGLMDQKPLPQGPRIVEGVAYWPPAAWPHPTTFVRRNLGFSLEAQPTYFGEDLRMEAAPNWVTLAGMAASSAVPVASGSWPATSLPKFSSNHVSGAKFTMPSWWASNHQASMLSTSRLMDELGEPVPGRSVLVFLTPHRVLLPDALTKAKVSSHRASVEWIEVESAEANALLATTFQSLEARDVREKRGALIEAKEARVYDLMMAQAWTPVDVSSNATELIYPTEFDPAEWPSYPAPENAGDALRFWSPRAYASPSTHATRNVGTHMKLTPSLLSTDAGSAGWKIEIDLDNVKYCGERAIQEIPVPEGKLATITQPIFYTMRIHTNFVCPHGGTVLLGAMTPGDEKGEARRDRKVLVFYHALD